MLSIYQGADDNKKPQITLIRGLVSNIKINLWRGSGSLWTIIEFGYQGIQ